MNLDAISYGDKAPAEVNVIIPLDNATRSEFRFPATHLSELVRDANNTHLATIELTRHEITGLLSVSSERIATDAYKLSIDVTNTSTSTADNRDQVLLSSLLSAHLILTVENGDFISLLDPPDHFREAVAACNNIGNFPVLVGSEGERDMLLCSPILLYDYPQIAPESAHNFYDSTEMDEMLTLRVMTLTDDEKNEIRSSADHVRELLERTEQTAREQLERTHGAIRSLRPASSTAVRNDVSNTHD